MTAKQFLDSIFQPNAEGLYDGIGPQDLVKFARQACERQRELCAVAAQKNAKSIIDGEIIVDIMVISEATLSV